MDARTHADFPNREERRDRGSGSGLLKKERRDAMHAQNRNILGSQCTPGCGWFKKRGFWGGVGALFGPPRNSLYWRDRMDVTPGGGSEFGRAALL